MTRTLAEREYLRNRKAVISAANGLCVKCGAAYDEVHHVYGRKIASTEMLRPLCQPCHLLLAPNGDPYWEWEKSGSSAKKFFEDGGLVLIHSKQLDMPMTKKREAAAGIAEFLLGLIPRTSERTKAGLARARREGKILGRPRADVKQWQVDKLRTDGMSLRKIASELKVGLGTVQRMCAAKVA